MPLSTVTREGAVNGSESPATTPHRPEPGGGLYRRLRSELAKVELPSDPPVTAPVTDADLDGLPAAARRYLGFMGVVGQTRHWSFRARFECRFQLRGRWMPAVAWQYNSAPEIGRVFVMRLLFARVVPMIGVDTYIGGSGEMRGKLLGGRPRGPRRRRRVRSR